MIRVASENKTPLRTRPTTLRVPNGLSNLEAQKYAEIPTEVSYIYDSSFSSAATEERLFGPETPRIAPPVWTEFPETVEDAHASPGRRSLSAKDEAQLFLQLNYARYRLAKLVIAQLRRISLHRARQMLLWHQRACAARDHLVTANMALVQSMARKIYFAKVDFAELVSEGNIALLRSVEKFNISRGYRFSTYACGSILRVLGRLAGKVGRYRHFFPTEFDPEFEHGDQNQFKQDRQWSDSVDALMHVLSDNSARLTPVERRVISERFAIASRTTPRTLGEIGQMMGLSNERVRQIQNVAMDKIRQAIDN